MNAFDTTEPGSAAPDPRPADERPIDPSGVLVVRRGPGANCSSVGSVLDLLFLSATLGGAALVVVTAALGRARAVPADAPPVAAPPPPTPRGGDGAR